MKPTVWHLQITKQQKAALLREINACLIHLQEKKQVCWKCSCSLDRNPSNPKRLHLSPDHCTVFKTRIRNACLIRASEVSEIVRQHALQSRGEEREDSLYLSVCHKAKQSLFIQTNYGCNVQLLKAMTTNLVSMQTKKKKPVLFALCGNHSSTTSTNIWIASRTADHQCSLLAPVVFYWCHLPQPQARGNHGSVSRWVTGVKVGLWPWEEQRKYLKVRGCTL